MTDNKDPSQPSAAPEEEKTNPRVRPATGDPLANGDDSLFSRALNQLMVVHAEQKQRDFDIFDPAGRFAEIQREHAKAHLDKLEEVLVVVQKTQGDIAQLTPRMRLIEDKIVGLEQKIGNLENDVSALKKELLDLRAAYASSKPPPAPAQSPSA